MKHTNINKTAMALAWLLLKINNVMTSKTKSFNYFLTVSYKMLKSWKHYQHVANGIDGIVDTMLHDNRVSSDRYGALLALSFKLCKYARSVVKPVKPVKPIILI